MNDLLKPIPLSEIHNMKNEDMNSNYKKQYNKNIKHINKIIKLSFVIYNKKALTVNINGSYKESMIDAIVEQYQEAGYYSVVDTTANNRILIALSEEYAYSPPIKFKGYADDIW